MPNLQNEYIFPPFINNNNLNPIMSHKISYSDAAKGAIELNNTSLSPILQKIETLLIRKWR